MSKKFKNVNKEINTIKVHKALWNRILKINCLKSDLISPILNIIFTANLKKGKMKIILFNSVLIIITFFAFMADSLAGERKFTYVYESPVLGKGSKEIEIWTTPRLGKDEGYFARLDNRVEFEVGLTNNLQAAFYLNFRNVTRDNNTGVNSTSFDFQGFSTEFKYQFSRPSKSIGFALYQEFGFNTDEIESETKLIFDKKIKKTTLALNLVFEPEWELSPGKSQHEIKFEETFGLSYAFSPVFSAGIETRHANVINNNGDIEHSALFAGPVLSVSQPTWWVTLTILPQVAAFKGKTGDSNLNLTEFEKFESRLIFSFHL